MPLLAAALPLLLAASSPLAAVAGALSVPGARVELDGVRTASGAGCAAESWEALKPVEASGAAALRFSGRTSGGATCQGFAWGKVRVLAPAAVTTRALREGEPLDGALATLEREVLPGHRTMASAPTGASAARRLAAGAVLDENAVRSGPAPGGPVTVLLRAGALSVEQSGRVVACARGRTCAVLPNGRRVEGRLEDGRLLVEVP
jgi:hypothetical protein